MQVVTTRPVGQAVKTLASHAGNMGSIPVRVTKIRKALLMQCFFDFEGSFRYENPASCKQGSHFYSLGEACPERSEDFDLPYGSPKPKGVPCVLLFPLPIRLVNQDPAKSQGLGKAGAEYLCVQFFMGARRGFDSRTAYRCQSKLTHSIQTFLHNISRRAT